MFSGKRNIRIRGRKTGVPYPECLKDEPNGIVSPSKFRAAMDATRAAFEREREVVAGTPSGLRRRSSMSSLKASADFFDAEANTFLDEIQRSSISPPGLQSDEFFFSEKPTTSAPSTPPRSSIAEKACQTPNPESEWEEMSSIAPSRQRSSIVVLSDASDELISATQEDSILVPLDSLSISTSVSSPAPIVFQHRATNLNKRLNNQQGPSADGTGTVRFVQQKKTRRLAQKSPKQVVTANHDVDIDDVEYLPPKLEESEINEFPIKNRQRVSTIEPKRPPDLEKLNQASPSRPSSNDFYDNLSPIIPEIEHSIDAVISPIKPITMRDEPVKPITMHDEPVNAITMRDEPVRDEPVQFTPIHDDPIYDEPMRDVSVKPAAIKTKSATSKTKSATGKTKPTTLAKRRKRKSIEMPDKRRRKPVQKPTVKNNAKNNVKNTVKNVQPLTPPQQMSGVDGDYRVKIVTPRVTEIFPQNATLLGPGGRPRRMRVRPLERWRGEQIVYKREKLPGIGIVSTIDKVVMIDPSPDKKKPTRVIKRAIEHKKVGEYAGESISLFAESLQDRDIRPDLELLIKDSQSGKAISGQFRALFTNEMANVQPLGGLNISSQLAFSFHDRCKSGIIELPPGTAKPERATGRVYFVYIVQSGRVSVKIHASTRELIRGEMFTVPPGNSYGIENLERTAARLYFVAVEMSEHVPQ